MAKRCNHCGGNLYADIDLETRKKVYWCTHCGREDSNRPLTAREMPKKPANEDDAYLPMKDIADKLGVDESVLRRWAAFEYAIDFRSANGSTRYRLGDFRLVQKIEQGSDCFYSATEISSLFGHGLMWTKITLDAWGIPYRDAETGRLYDARAYKLERAKRTKALTA